MNQHLISHKPRSGKSITILNICNWLLQNGHKKILIMTSVPSTIDSFINDLNLFIDFKDIKYKKQDEFNNVHNEFNGIIFCSVQYLKVDPIKKKKYLKNINFDTMIIDECHMGSSTEKTQTEILNVESDIDEIRKNIKLNIFASGTSDKTRKFYKIKCVYEWEIQDEGYMKELLKDNVKNDDKQEIFDIMTQRHGKVFMECYNNNNVLNKDYSRYPTQVLMKYSIPNELIETIKKYNDKHNTNYGFSSSSIFALNKLKSGKYEDRFSELRGVNPIFNQIEMFTEYPSNNDTIKSLEYAASIHKEVNTWYTTYSVDVERLKENGIDLILCGPGASKLISTVCIGNFGFQLVGELKPCFRPTEPCYSLWELALVHLAF
jgi:hypothetical protein